MNQYYTKEIKSIHDLLPNERFVFGSNLAGRHGAGAAKFAREQLGAKYGIGAGVTGRCYALPTKDVYLRTLPIEAIQINIELFISIARVFDDELFYVTKVGCGLAGCKDSYIAPLFKGSPRNCRFHLDWKQYLEEVNNATH